MKNKDKKILRLAAELYEVCFNRRDWDSRSCDCPLWDKQYCRCACSSPASWPISRIEAQNK